MRQQRFLALLAGFMVMGAHVGAQVTWLGTAGSQFSSGLNWNLAQAPANNGTAAVQFSGTFITAPIVDVAYSLASVTYLSGVQAFTLSGAASVKLTLTSGISQQGPNQQTLSLPVVLSGSGVTFSGPSSGSAILNLTGGLEGTAPLAVTSGLNLKVSGGWSATGSLAVQSGASLEFGSGTFTVTNPIANAGTLSVAAGGTKTLAGVISGTGALSVGGSLTLSGTNTYSGATGIQTGATLVAAGAGALPSTTDVQLAGTGQLQLSAAQTIRGLASTSATSGVVLGTGTSLTINNPTGATSTFAGVLSGSGSLIKAGPGTLELSGVSTYGGATQINGGTVTLLAAGVLPSSTAVALSASGVSELNLNGFNQQLGGLSGGASSTVRLGSGTLTVGGVNGQTSFSGVVTGAGGVTKVGTGTLTLTGASDFTGPVNINAGVLAVSGVSSLGAASTGTTVVAGATLQVTGAALSEPLSISGAGAGASGAVLLGGNASLSGAITLAANAAIGVQDATSVISGAFAEGGAGRSLIKLGNGSLSLTNAANAWSGGTIVSGGILEIAAAGALPAGSAVTINGLTSAAQLYLKNGGGTVGSVTLGGSGAAAGLSNKLELGYGQPVTLSGDVTVSSASSPGVALIQGGTLSLGSGSHVFSVADSTSTVFDLKVTAAVGGAGSIVKSGLGALLLYGSNSFSGGLTVSAGTVYVGYGTSAGTGTVSVAAGASLAGGGSYSSSTVTLSNAVTLADGAVLGSLLAGGNQLSFTGPVTVGSSTSLLHLGGDGRIMLESASSLAGPSAGTAITFDSNGRGSGGRIGLVGAVDANVASITAAEKARVVFGSTSSLPASLTVAASDGYVGVAGGDSAGVPASALLARIANRGSFAGTFGFDTPSSSFTPSVFGEALSFTGFGGSFTLGSASKAVLTGGLTPPGNTFAFGNGGGVLFVQSNLADGATARGVSVASVSGIKNNVLAVAFQGANTYSGNLSVTNSVAVLDSAGALPATASIVLGSQGYAGYTERAGFGSFSAFASRLASGYASNAALGFDSQNTIKSALGQTYSGALQRNVTETLDLSLLGPIYLGTATSAWLAGPIFAPNQSGAARTLSLMAGEGNVLTVSSPLIPGRVNSLVIGTGSLNQAGGSVTLAGSSTFSGGTTFLGGTLGIGSSSKSDGGGNVLSGPLGTGSLMIAASAQAPTLLGGGGGEVILGNALRLGSNLQIGVAPSTGYYVSNGSTLALMGPISDLDGSNHGGLKVYANTVLYGSNTFTGGVLLQSAGLWLGNNAALGTGALNLFSTSEVYSASLLAIHAEGGPRTIPNAVSVNLFGDNWLRAEGDGTLTFSGPVTLNSSLTLDARRYPAYLTGGVGGSGGLVGAGYQPVILSGTNSYSGGTQSYVGAIIFSSANSIPATSFLTSGSSGYVGVASPVFGSSLQADFIDRFLKADTLGGIGFDTLTAGSPNSFSGPISLTGFGSSARLGSATQAILTGTITPQGSTYNFGNGGGLLRVSSILGGSFGLDLSSGSAPLTLRLTGANTYTGPTAVHDSAVVFGAGALPASTVLQVGSRAYAGTEEASLLASPATFVARFDSSATSAIVGFDSFTGSPAAVSGAINLTAFTSAGDPGIFLGTATLANLQGAITLPANQSTYRFTGYKGGQLVVGSVLDGSRAVQIGDAYTPAMWGHPTDLTVAPSSVTLAGNNSYVNGTTLAGGRLLVGRNSALGTGTLTVLPPAFATSATVLAGIPQFGSASATDPVTGQALVVPNDVYLQAADLAIVGGESFRMSGVISGFGSLIKSDGGTLSLSGSNTFSGGIQVIGGAVQFLAASAPGGGALKLSGGSAAFQVTNTVYGISSGYASDQISVATGAALTVIQNADAVFAGTFGGTGITLNFQGNGLKPTLQLMGTSAFTGSVTINSDVTIRAGAVNVFGSSANAITVTGGRLEAGAGVTISNPLSVTGGALGGTGTFQPTAGLTIGSGAGLAPGFDGVPGTLQFSNALLTSGAVLNLAASGNYRWQINDATGAGGWDTIVATGPVAITSTQLFPFTLSIKPVGSLELLPSIANFNPNLAYSWNLLTASSISGFSPSVFAVNTTDVADLINGGSFSFSLTGSGTALTLNFNPSVVPEPSTYALLGLGAVAVLMGSRRRRR